MNHACKRILPALFFLALLMSVPGKALAVLPDTGQTSCYDNGGLLAECPSPGEDFYGQDGNFDYYPPSYTDNGDNTVTDDRTNLVWEKNTDNQLYSWEEAGNYCDGLDLGGAQDWRRPSQWELETLIIYDGSSPAYDPVFTNAKTDAYWTSQVEITTPTLQAWALEGPWTGFYEQLSTLFVRCVRSGPMGHGNFTDNGDGTVSDSDTGLVWQQETVDEERTWQQALAYCNDLVLDGKTDWRLPNQRELNTTLNLNATDPGTGALSFTPLQTIADVYWSSSTQSSSGSQAWIISFQTGESGTALKTDPQAYARCVRGGQPRQGNGPAVNLLLKDEQQ